MSTDTKIVPIHHEGDASLPEAGLWLDPHRARTFAFVSHAHADHFAPHGRILTSTATRRLIESRFGAKKTEFISLDFGETHDLGNGYRITLYPAGHICGSAMLLAERQEDGATLLHTGDFKTRPGRTAERCQPVHADTLIMETTFGIPRFRLPPSEKICDAMAKFAAEALEDGEIPVFLGYSLGKAQEILSILADLRPELEFQLHSSVAKMTEAVAELGYPFPTWEIFDPKERSPEGKVVILPPSAGRSQAIRLLRKKVRIAMVTGWGVDSGARYRYQADEVFPLSDHAGYEDLHAFVDEVQPKRVFTIHGYMEEFARDLRSRGVEAWPLQGVTQMELSISDENGVPSSAQGEETSPPPLTDSEFGRFAAVAAHLSTVTGKLKKREILSNYLRELSADTLAAATTFLTGNPFPRTAEVRTTNVGWAVIRRALLQVTGLSPGQYRQISTSQADAARTAHLVLEGKTEAHHYSLLDLQDFFRELAQDRGPESKIERLAEQLGKMHHVEGALVVAILTGDLRIGLKEGLLEDSIADAFGQDPVAIREAHMLLGDLGRTALLASDDRLAEASVTWFTPLKVMLASPEDTAEDIFDRLGGNGAAVWLEDKFDGIRAQLHRRGNRVELFSRDLRPLHKEFPEIVESARELDRDVILDGEIIAWAEGKKLNFFDLQKRLGRQNQGDLFFGAAVPVRFIAFDILAIDESGLIEKPLSERRNALGSVGFSGALSRCEVYSARSPAEIDDAFNEARRRENEGLIAKDPNSLYTPGRRGKTWLKLKKAMPTLDCVVVKAEQGHGKRAHVLSDYTFSVRDSRTGELRVVGKAYSGLTDLEIEELTEYFKEIAVEKSRKAYLVEPKLVLEIAFDSINPSKRHDSGLALRFPRIKAIRRDKTIDEIDTLQYARKLAGIET